MTITLKPDEGYEVAGVTVTDANGNAVPVTNNGDGTWSFIMPATTVSVTPAFNKIGEKPATAFVDVPEDAYYSDAVTWAVAKDVTTGTDETHFSPKVPCTRAQMVTFLWRASGSPEPAGDASKFTDVAAGSYYEKAVAWAIENGITKGVSETEFAPNDTVTRAQTVTFLYRYAGASAEASSVFVDVPKDAWYAEAVTWAAAEGITKGVDATHFAPNDNCVRAQIVTFLYRFMGEA